MRDQNSSENLYQPPKAELLVNKQTIAVNEGPAGLGGWLVLVGIGIVLSPLRILVEFLSIYAPIFTNGTWEKLTDPASDRYIEYWGSVIVGEMFFNVMLFLCAIYLVYLFFTRRRFFPIWFIGITVFTFVFVLVDAWVVTLVVPGQQIMDPETVSNLVRLVVAICIWVPYMLVSKRVKNTFVK